ncbi:MAG: 1-acyl-sn-glycerol-3-phosphate acyltransferase [Deltaproteobacteria bacterium]|nr:1-acyl-sn-glycerol-3-phosphate acyltransferase [Deltaproteobacteria bacterium]
MDPIVHRQAEGVPVDLGLALHASGMRRHFGILFHLLGLGLLFRPFRLEPHSEERIRRAVEAGPVVYALYNRNLLDWLALNVALNGRDLPLASFTPGLGVLWLLPLGEIARTLLLRLQWRRERGPVPDPVASGWLSRLLGTGRNACIFMVPPDRGTSRPAPDVAEALLEGQERSERPLQVVPVAVVWDRAPPPARTEIARIVRGSSETPGPIARLYNLMRQGADAIVQAGEPIDLHRFVEHYQGETPSRRVRILRVALRRHLYREQSVVRGPRVRSRAWMRRLVLSSKPVQDLIRHEVAITGQSVEKVQRRVAATYDRIAAQLSFSVMHVAYRASRLLFTRLYSGVDIRPADFDIVRQAQRRGTPILVPCHRSHLDYLLMSTTLYQHDLAIPYIAAGLNLSFWPVGPLVRRLGAFFVKRTFKGDRLFGTVFAQYVRQLVREAYPVEFFIEGTRSRTGKLLPPKLGMVGMVMDAAANLARKDFDVTFLPINISYEQIAEEKAYARELAGERKKDESLGDVARASKVLRHRFGRVYLRFGTPILASEVLEGLDRPWEGLSKERRNEILQFLGERILHRINQQAVVLPTSLVAMALLSHRKRGIRREALLGRVERLRGFLKEAGAETSATLAHPAWAVDQALHRFLSGRKVVAFEDEAGPIYRVSDESRITLDFYKNTLVHWFVPASLLALVLRWQVRRAGGSLEHTPDGGLPVDQEEAERTFRFLAWLFRYEFVFDPESTAEATLDQATHRLAAYGATSGGREDLRIADVQRVSEIASLLSNFVESYWITLKAAHGLRHQDFDGSTLVAAIRKIGMGMYQMEEVRRSESLSVLNLTNAVRAFKEEGVFRMRSGGGGLEFEPHAYDETLRLLGELME